ncbi:MAG: tRNA threonylcarbamoyladenosine dehydratase [Bacteroidetes bacterium GWF2_42_66]|nr:MAG: tRNA threonylcarbamoyladenosine dehydratase [Bacteroidetes bacterium GWA2_42_15]OFY01055.1 MAG: tRNA threonylcarbamoyladenosine dehydratase [Bacteroidetes bacterium GWE2_42_39]OFY41898.1 MAG: tRNA threonylcarbamoyladenosine dehydratase [Bacteroidetes bacterium GWF2_42_66]HBL77924.1 tRNA threonylcarbamoyladenosine dehydratase [Prolixibacteraceae bacterium]HCR90147.1 tRNA threonylcarbamoyladenosine dehydratase [Prolixibacteraceae bacterium]
MDKWKKRTSLLLGKDGIKRLENATILVIGLGGVGAYAAEQLCRAGIGKMTIVDGDVVEETNRNRQLPALISNEGKPKAEVLAQRFLDINPKLKLTVINEYLKDERILEVIYSDDFDYAVDAIDTLSPKTFLIYHCVQKGLPVVSSMGAGGKFDPSKVSVADISKSFNCGLAKMLRKRLHRMGIKKGVQVVFSSELMDKSKIIIEDGQNKKSTVGTISYMPPVFGCFIASAVITGLLQKDGQ